MRSSARTEKEQNSTDARTTAADEGSRKPQAPPREFAGSASNRKAGVSVRIGTIEVRTTATPAPPAPEAAPPEAQSKRAESHFGPRPTSRDSLSSGLAWNYGLVQG
jgi:hypothetical protein